MQIRSTLVPGVGWPGLTPVRTPGGRKPRRFNPQQAEEVRLKIKELGSIKAAARFYECSTDLLAAVNCKRGAYKEDQHGKNALNPAKNLT